jgi:hypothetical protein
VSVLKEWEKKLLGIKLFMYGALCFDAFLFDGLIGSENENNIFGCTQ